MSNEKLQAVTRDENGDFREALLDLAADPVTGKMVAIGTDRNPVLHEAAMLFELVPVPLYTGQYEFMMRGTERLQVPVGYTYQFEFSVLLVHADFSVQEFRGFATVQNTGGVVAGVGHWYTLAMQLWMTWLPEFIWFGDGMGAGTYATYQNGGPGNEDFSVRLYLDTLSSENAVRFRLDQLSAAGVSGQLQVRILNKLFVPLPDASSASSDFVSQYVINGAEYPWPSANGTYAYDGEYIGHPSWADPDLMYLWNNGSNWIISSGKGSYYAATWLGPAADQAPSAGVYLPQNDAVGTITVTPA